MLRQKSWRLYNPPGLILMQCFIYRCNLKPDMYVYLAEEDMFDNVPRQIFDSLGIIEFSMEVDISEQTKLAREDVKTVIANLKAHGFHIQLPSKESVETIMARISAAKNAENPS